MKRFLCLFFTVLTLISLTIPAFAESTSLDDLPPLDMDNTSIEYDFEHVFLDDYSLSDYRANPLKNCVELITMAEKGYGKLSNNLLDINNPIVAGSTGYEVIDNSTIVFTPTQKNSTFKYLIKVEIGKQYTVSVEDFYNTLTTNTSLNRIGVGNTVNPDTHEYGYVKKDEPLTFTATSEDLYIKGYACFTYNEGQISTLIKPMVIEGSTIHSYEPYSFYSLYFYLYNPSQHNIIQDSENNLIQFGSNVTGGIKSDPRYKKHQLKLIDTYGATEETETHTNALVLKFSLLNYDDFIFLDEFTSRFYDVSGVELVIDENSNATEYGVAQVFEFYEVNGFPICSIDKTEVLRIDDLEFSFYRVKSEVPNVYKDLQSVSFSIPNSIINKCGEINALHAVWKECLTQPVLIANDAKVVNEFQKILNQEVPSDFKYSFGYETIFDDFDLRFSIYQNYFYTFNFQFNSNINLSDKDIYPIGLGEYDKVSIENPYNNLIDKLYFVEYSKDVFDPNSVCVTSEQMLSKLDEYKWSDDVFTSIDNTNFNLENPTLFDLTYVDELGVYRVPTFWEKIIKGGLNNILIEDSKKFGNIERIEIKDKKMSNDNFAEAYLVFKDDVDEIKALMMDDVTTYILHYTVTDYITHEAFIYNDESDKPLCNAIVGQPTAIRNFDFIDMYFKKGDVITCLAIGMDPQNFAPALTGHDKPLPEDRWAEFLESLEKLLGIAIILAVITIALKIFTMFKKNKVKVVVKNEKIKR